METLILALLATPLVFSLVMAFLPKNTSYNVFAGLNLVSVAAVLVLSIVTAGDVLMSGDTASALGLWFHLYIFCARACEDATKGYGLAVDDFCKLPFLLLETAATVQQREKALDVFDETFRSNVIQMENFLRETNR